MAIMNPVLRLRRAFRSVAAPEGRSEAEVEEVADEAADAVGEYGYSRQESDLRFERIMAEMRREREEMRREIAEFRTQVILAIFIAAGVIITAVGVLIAVLD